MPRPRPIRDFVRSSFIAGLFVALPLAITIAALAWIWQQMDPWLSRLLGFAETIGPWGHVLDAVNESQYSELIVPILGLLILLFAVLVLGVLIRSIIGRFLLAIFEGLMYRVPLAGSLYSSIKHLSEAFGSADGESKFQKAVLVQFPMPGTWVIGFVTGTAIPPFKDALAQKPVEGQPKPQQPELITVFVPTTPLPTQGFTLILPQSEVRELGVPVSDALSLVISAGMSSTPGASNRRQPVSVPESRKSGVVKTAPAPTAPEQQKT